MVQHPAAPAAGASAPRPTSATAADGVPGPATEASLRRFRDAEDWPRDEALAAMLDSQHSAFVAVHRALPALGAAVAAAAPRLGETGRLIYCGAGASGRLAAQDGVELYPTFGWPLDRLHFLMAGGEPALVRAVEGAEDDAEAGRHEMLALRPTPADVVLSVAASGTTRYTRAAQAAARAAGAVTVGFSNNPGAPLLMEAEFPVALETGPEFLAGSTRMGAGTAQKIALNLFSTRLMTELGRVYRGLMVNVVATNAKLVERSRRIIAALADAPYEDAAAAWDASGGDISRAVLMLDGVGRDEAAARLLATRNNLRRARETLTAERGADGRRGG